MFVSRLVTIIFNRDTEENWNILNPVVPKDCPIAVMENPDSLDEVPKWKMGDGQRRFNELPYCNGFDRVQIDLYRRQQVDYVNNS